MRTLTILASLLCVTAVTAEPIEIGPLKADMPEGWKKERPENRMRAAQVKWPGVGGAGDAEMLVFYFGPRGAGSVDANMKRWQGMMQPPGGKEIDDVTKKSELKVNGEKAPFMAIDGTYKSRFPPFAPRAKTVFKKDYRMLTTIVPTAQGPYFIRITGPAATVKKYEPGFKKWLTSLK